MPTMSVRRITLSHVALHLSGVGFVAAIAWAAGVGHETIVDAIVVIAGIAAVSWAVFGTLWWLIGMLVRRHSHDGWRGEDADASRPELRNSR